MYLLTVGNGDLADMFPPPPLPARNGGLVSTSGGGGGGNTVWNTASSYDVRDVTAIALSQSRENTLSRDLVSRHSVSEGERERGEPNARDINVIDWDAISESHRTRDHITQTSWDKNAPLTEE